jgi:nucleotide-binding universal stress UspA family protein
LESGGLHEDQPVSQAFATRNGADHIVMGARASSALRRYLGSVSAQVVAESPCTVTVVRETERAASKDQ